KPSFFFSSRRRHTRSKHDWSSDVCSSDLSARNAPLPSRPSTSVDGRLGNGAFLALRLVDLLGPGSEPAHPDAFRYQHAATERMCRELPATSTETGHLTGLVRSAAEAFRSRNPGQVIPALLAYAHHLEDELRLEEALDVL